MAALFCSIVLALLSALFHQPIEADNMTDWNRVLSTFNRSYDNCRDVTQTTGLESRMAVDNMCEEAFRALDRLRLNTCVDWGDAKCRFIGADQQAQCTCKISVNIDRAGKKDVFKAFRECAEDLRLREQNTEQALVPTPLFQENWGSHNIAWNLARSHLPQNHPGSFDRTGKSRGKPPAGGIGRSSSAYLRGLSGSFGGLQTTGGASSSWDAFTSRFSGPSTEAPSCAPGVSGTKISEPRSGWLDLNKVPNSYECDQCEASFMSELALLMHIKVHNKAGNTHCDICNYSFANRSIFLAHLRNQHTKLAMEVKAGEQMCHDFLCGDCGKTFKTKNGLRDHEKSHNTLDTYCGQCDKIHSTKQNYISHLKRKHPTTAEFQADRARKRFKEEHPEKCQKCSKRFKNTRGLRDHLPFHDGGTTCNECNAILPSVSTLATHKRKEHQHH